jgi:hypothetical protein
VKKYIPVGSKSRPVFLQNAAELVALVLRKHDFQRRTMMELEYGVGVNELLDQKCRRTDFARRVFDGRLVDTGVRVAA